MDNDTYFGQVRHWLVSNVSSDSDGSLNISQGTEITPYLGPAPLPNYLYSRPHRYVFIVASASGKVDITPEDLQELQQPYVAAISGKQEVQDLKDRWGFNAQKLIEKKGLKVEAANFMRVHGTLGSAATNLGLMGQAALNKVSPQGCLFGGGQQLTTDIGSWEVKDSHVNGLLRDNTLMAAMIGSFMSYHYAVQKYGRAPIGATNITLRLQLWFPHVRFIREQ